MMAQLPLIEVELRCRLTWWFETYLATVGFLCGLFDREPDWDKVFFWMRHGVVIELRFAVGRSWERVRLTTSPPRTPRSWPG
jgi:hypothetical protein